MAQRVGRGIALLFNDRGTTRGWVVSSTPQPQFTPGKDPVPILQEAGRAPGPVWTGGKSRPHRDSIPDRPARSQSLYWLSYPANTRWRWVVKFTPGSLHPGKKPMYRLNRRLGGPRGRSGRFEEKKNLVLVPPIKPRIIQTIVWSLYRLEQTVSRALCALSIRTRDIS